LYRSRDRIERAQHSSAQGNDAREGDRNLSRDGPGGIERRGLYMDRSGMTGRHGIRTSALLALALATGLGVAGCGDSTTEPPPEPPPAPQLPVEPPQSLQDCVTGASSDGALLEVCLPSLWNGEMITWAHGYTNPGPDRPPGTPLALPSDEIGGREIRDIARGIGNGVSGYYGYATTSYRRNGLVAAEAAEDLEDLARFAHQNVGGLVGVLRLPAVSYLVGASEGGLSTALALEEGRSVEAYDGGMALCGPVGDFRRQLEHLGDFRVVFDYYFPGVMPGSAVGVPDPVETITDARWEALQGESRAALAADPEAADQLFRVTGVALDEGDSESLASAAVDVLRYSFFGTNDATAVLGGNAFGNTGRSYSGSDDDEALNEGVERFTADPTALTNVESRYETSGRLRVPLVAMHTTRDPIVPFWHQALYEEKVILAGSGSRITVLPSQQYGHCRFTLPELVAAFSSLVVAVTSQNLATSGALFADVEAQREFLELARAYGASPTIVEGSR
jgi:hypothetical protein